MSSLLAFHGTPRAAHYAATKAYVQSLAEGLRVEWAPVGVDVIASAPGPIRSGFAARAGLQMAQALPAEVVARVTLQALGRRTTVRLASVSVAKLALGNGPGWRRHVPPLLMLAALFAGEGRVCTGAHRGRGSRSWELKPSSPVQQRWSDTQRGSTRSTRVFRRRR